MYKRVLLKLSGEALSSPGNTLDFSTIEQTALQIKEAARMGVELGIVLGGGNIWRGRSSGSMDRNRADHMGMLATAINALAMQDMLQSIGVGCTVLSAVPMERFCDSFSARAANAALSQGNVVLFACGSGSPFFSTDTAAALRAAEIGADVLLLAKNIDAIYSVDPHVDQNAKRYSHLSYQQIIEQNLKAADITAITLCREQHIPIVAFGLKEPGSIVKAVSGKTAGTLIDGE